MSRALLVGTVWLLVLSSVGVRAEDGVSESARTAVEADWAKQETTAGRIAGSPASITLAIASGRRLAIAQHPLGLRDEADACLRVLAGVERRLGSLLAGTTATDGPALETDDGWHLVRATVCGAGPELDVGRVAGADYRYPVTPRRASDGAPTELHTVSFADRVVIYRFDGLDPSAHYRLRTLYGVDAQRSMALSVNGRRFHEVTIPAGAAIEQVDEVPADLIVDGVLEIQAESVGAINAILSALELWSTAPEVDPERRVVLARQRRSTSWERSPVDPHGLALYHEARWAGRKLLFAHPALDFDELLFVRRHWPYFDHQCSHRVGESQIPGADLCVLAGLSPDGAVRGLLPPEMSERGGVGRPDLSFDGTRIVFPYARPREPATPYGASGGHASYDSSNPTDSTAYRGGACHMYDIYEVGVDGTRLVRLTESEDSEDTEPCYLPDGRIVFTSSRGGRLVQCGDWALVFGLWAMDADGGDQRPITEPQDTEFYPAMLGDGRILYTRWDYVMKPYNVIQQLWTVNPDGTGAQLAYGDWFEFSVGPLALQEARQIPGTSKVVAIGAAHHNTAVGPLMVVDLGLNRGGPDGFVNLSPEIGYPEAFATDERDVILDPDIAGISNTSNATGWFASPYPLSEDLFLVSYSFDSAGTSPTGYGIYLVHRDGIRELVYRSSEASCYAPIPLRRRTAPPQLPPMPRPSESQEALLYVGDVHKGLDGVPPGTVRWLRICQTYPKLRHTNPHRVDAGVGSGWDMRGVLGVVPVEEDGSAYFSVPAGSMIFLEALDEDFLEVKRMRNYIDLRPGEVRGCVGCHERPSESAPSTTAGAQAFRRPPSPIAPPPWGAGPLRFPEVVQPVLDRNCIGCHDGSDGAERAFDLRGLRSVEAPHAGDADEGPQHLVSDSFLALLPHVRYVQLAGHAGRKLPLAPYEVGSAASPLMQLLRTGHHAVSLPLDDWRALAAWIDCNAPYYGSYDDEFLLAASEPGPAGRAR